jgi:hypothetical protein
MTGITIAAVSAGGWFGCASAFTLSAGFAIIFSFNKVN